MVVSYLRTCCETERLGTMVISGKSYCGYQAMHFISA